MQPESLRERASKAAEESRAILALLNAFELGFEKRWLEALRRSVTEEVEQAYQKVMEEAKAKEEEISRHAESYRKEVWTYAAYSEDLPGYILSADEMGKESAWVIAAEMSEKGRAYLPVEDFKRQIQKLKASILEGELDKHLHLPTEQLIYNKMQTPRSQRKKG